MCCEDYFRQELTRHGYRLTPQREIVLDVLHDMRGHVTAEEVADRVHQVTQAVDISTVYRTLELLHKFGLVAVVTDAEGGNRYELLSVSGPHHHLRCRACGRLVRIEGAALDSLSQALAGRYGFQAEPEHLIIEGLCAECRQAARW